MYYVNLFFFPFSSKGDVENAVKYLEMYVEVAEQSEAQESLAKAYSAIGAMHNTLVKAGSQKNGTACTM